MKNKFKYIFVVLVYRNTDDIIEFIKSVQAQVKDFRIVIVNSYYDDVSKEAFATIASTYSCDFLNVENRGYGYGNNRGFEFAIENYDFDFIILSNPDIEIEKFDTKDLMAFNDRLIGPKITTNTGKSQNPYWVIENRICEFLIYSGYKKRSRLLFYIGIIINKIIRESYLILHGLLRKTTMPVYALHGSFVIFPKKVLDITGHEVYDENIFLFSEEADLAHKLKHLNVKSIVTLNVQVHHKEDGSMGVAKIDEKSEARKAVMYYYEKYHKKRR